VSSAVKSATTVEAVAMEATVVSAPKTAVKTASVEVGIIVAVEERIVAKTAVWVVIAVSVVVVMMVVVFLCISSWHPQKHRGDC